MRLERWLEKDGYFEVSIHARVERATVDKNRVIDFIKVSIHARVERATRRGQSV